MASHPRRRCSRPDPALSPRRTQLRSSGLRLKTSADATDDMATKKVIPVRLQATRLRLRDKLRAALLRPEFTAFVSTIVVFAFFAIDAGDQGFLSFSGTKNYLEVAAETGIIA